MRATLLTWVGGTSLIVACVALIGCMGESETYSNRSPAAKCKPATTNNLVAIVDYKTDVEPILHAKCTNCHSSTAASGKRKTPYFETFDTAKTNYTGIYSEANQGSMPPSGTKLSASELELLRGWQTSNFVETKSTATPDTGTGTTTTNYSYTNDIQPLLASKCVSCHTPGKKKPDLSTYALVKASASAVAASVANGSMPVGGSLTASQKTMIQSWVDAGAPESSSATSTGTTNSSTTNNSSNATSNSGCL